MVTLKIGKKSFRAVCIADSEGGLLVKAVREMIKKQSAEDRAYIADALARGCLK